MGIEGHNYEATPAQEQHHELTKLQKEVLNRISELLNNPETIKKVTEDMKMMFIQLSTDLKGFDRLQETIGQEASEQLLQIQRDYEKGNMTGTEAQEKSAEIIKHTTRLQLYALQTQASYQKTEEHQ